jgi:hypothetical protein
MRSAKQQLTEKKQATMGKAMVFFWRCFTFEVVSLSLILNKATLGIGGHEENGGKSNGKRKRATSEPTRASSVPTPSNIYRELMASANREPLSMYQKKTQQGKFLSIPPRLNQVVT